MNIFVGSSSRDTQNAVYNAVAEEIGDFIVENKHNYVFGGCEYGLMGKVYSVVSGAKDSKIYVVQAKAYADDINSLDFDEAVIADTVNERKNAYTKYSDVLLFLPGGIGTIDEILTAIETRRNHEHNLPIIIVNVCNFFDPLLKMLESIYAEGFADEKNKECYFVATSIQEAKDYLQAIAHQYA